MCYDCTTLCDASLRTFDAKVLGQQGAIDAVHHVVQLLAMHDRVIMVSDWYADIIADVAANWVSRILGEARVYHLGSATRRQVEAVYLVVSLFINLCWHVAVHLH